MNSRSSRSGARQRSASLLDVAGTFANDPVGAAQVVYVAATQDALRGQAERTSQALVGIGRVLLSRSLDDQLSILSELRNAARVSVDVRRQSLGAQLVADAAAEIIAQPPEVAEMRPGLVDAALSVIGLWSSKVWVDAQDERTRRVEELAAERSILDPQPALDVFTSWIKLGHRCEHGRARYLERIAPAFLGIADADHASRRRALDVALQSGWSDRRLVPLILERLHAPGEDLTWIARGLIDAQPVLSPAEQAEAIDRLLTVVTDDRPDRDACLQALAHFNAGGQGTRRPRPGT